MRDPLSKFDKLVYTVVIHLISPFTAPVPVKRVIWEIKGRSIADLETALGQKIDKKRLDAQISQSLDLLATRGLITASIQAGDAEFGYQVTDAQRGRFFDQFVTRNKENKLCP